MLTHEQAKEAVNLAMKIETGCIDFDHLLDVLAKQPQMTEDLITFWMQFNTMTRSAIKVLVYEKCRRHLEKCFVKEA